ncbi:MAG: sugar ABC transporter permease [Clostridiales bacterium]|mgnify:CR=1 FL=1|nr:sugar ABC transporter permease [Clostridiales bacterium]
MVKKRANIRLFILFVVPAMFIWITVVLIPFIYGLFITLTDWNGLSADFNFIGLKNYLSVFSDGSFIESLKKTFIYSFSSVIFSNILGLAIALALTGKIKGQNLFRMGFFTPNIIGGIILGYIWNFIFAFALTSFGKSIGWEVLEKSFLTDPNKAMLALIIVTTWQMSGYLMVIYIAGLINVPNDIIEASEIDGAGMWNKIRYVKIPMIRNSIAICVFLTITRTFMAFDINLSLTAGGPYKSTEMISYKIYQTAFSNMKFGLGQAQAVVLFVIVAIVSLLQVTVTRKGDDLA